VSEFFQTIMGRQFYEGAVPRIAKALERIAAALETDKQSKTEETAPVVWIFEVSCEDMETYSAHPTERDALVRAGSYILSRFERVDDAVEAQDVDPSVPENILALLENEDYRHAILLFHRATAEDLVVREAATNPNWTREVLLNRIELRRQFRK